MKKLSRHYHYRVVEALNKHNNFNQKLNFIPITDKNLQKEACRMQVAHGQEDFIESVEACLEEAKECPYWRPILIQMDNTNVGFAMYGLWINEGDNGRIWLDRFLIDKKFQGKGYSKIILPELLKKIKNEFDYYQIYLSVYDTNPIAIKIYQSLGFQFNGELDSMGEKVMVLDI